MLKNILRQIKLDKEILTIIIGSKITIFLIIFLAYNLLPFAKNYYYVSFIYPPNEKISLKSAFKTWDAQHYLFLSEQGYKPDNESNRFYPLFPMLIKFSTYFTRNSFLSGLLISNLFSLVGLYLFYKFVKDFFGGEKIAFSSLLLLLFFPTSFYFFLIYSESLFFLLAIAFFYFLFKKKYLIAGLFSFLIPLSRPVGVFIILPFLFYFIFKKEKIKFQERIRFNQQSFFLIFPILGFLLYLAIIYLSTSSPFSGFSAANLVVSRWDIFEALLPQGFFINFFSNNLQIHGFTNSIIDRVFFIFFLFSLILIYKKCDLTLFVYSLFMGSAPLFGSFMSYSRYILLIFPIFIVLAMILEEKKYNFLKIPFLFLSFSLQILFLIIHALNYWVA